MAMLQCRVGPFDNLVICETCGTAIAEVSTGTIAGRRALRDGPPNDDFNQLTII